MSEPRDIIWLPAYRPTPVQIIQQVADRRRVTMTDIRGPSRVPAVAHARQEAMWELRQRTRMSMPRIGHFFDRHHTTVLWALSAHEARMAAEREGAAA